MKRYLLLLAAAALTLAGCSAVPNARQAAAPTTASGPTMVAVTAPAPTTAAPMMGPAQAFNYQDINGYRYRFSIRVGQASPTASAPNCTQGGFNAAPGYTNVPVVVTITNLLTDRNEPAPSVTLAVPPPAAYDLFMGPDVAGTACDDTLSPGRWFNPGESIVMRGYYRNVPDPIPAGAYVEFDLIGGPPVNNLHVLLKQ
jgi:hypothetical protein